MKLAGFGGPGWEITLCFHSCSLSANLIYLKLFSLEMKGGISSSSCPAVLGGELRFCSWRMNCCTAPRLSFPT